MDHGFVKERIKGLLPIIGVAFLCLGIVSTLLAYVEYTFPGSLPYYSMNGLGIPRPRLLAQIAHFVLSHQLIVIGTWFSLLAYLDRRRWQPRLKYAAVVAALCMPMGFSTSQGLEGEIYSKQTVSIPAILLGVVVAGLGEAGVYQIR